jgi:hypothetical protein
MTPKSYRPNKKFQVEQYWMMEGGRQCDRHSRCKTFLQRINLFELQWPRGDFLSNREGLKVLSPTKFRNVFQKVKSHFQKKISA